MALQELHINLHNTRNVEMTQKEAEEWLLSLAEQASTESAAGELHTALELRQQVLCHAQTLYGEGSTQVVEAIHELGLAHYDNEDYESAVEWLEQGLARIPRCRAPPGHSDGPPLLHGELMLGLGNACYAQGKFAEAKTYFDRCAAQIELECPKGSPLLVPVLFNVGLVLLGEDSPSQALELFTRALRLAECILGGDRLDVACICHNLGVAHDRLGDLAQAVHNYSKAMAIREKVLGKLHCTTAASYSNLSQVLLDARRYEDALPILIRLSRALIASHGQHHLQTANSCFDIGLTCLALGKSQRALKYLRRAHQIRESQLSPTHPDTVAVLKSLQPLLLQPST